MKSIFLVILLVGLSTVLIGSLFENDILISTANIVVLDDPTELTINGCRCQDPNNPDNYSPEFCDFSSSEKESICVANQIPAPLSNNDISDSKIEELPPNNDISDSKIEELPPNNDISDNKIEGLDFNDSDLVNLLDDISLEEGCNAAFWRGLQGQGNQIKSWPPEYQPDFHFNDIFLTSLDNSYFLTAWDEPTTSIHQMTRGDVIDELQKLKTQYDGDNKSIEKLESAIISMENSLNPSLWIDDLHLDPKNGKQVFEEDKNALLSLTLLVENQQIVIPNSYDENKEHEEEKLLSLQEISRDIINSQRSLVQNAVEDSKVYGKDTEEMNLTVMEFNNGQEKFHLGEYLESLTFYKNSWIHSQNALELNNAGNSYGPTLLEVLGEKPNHHSNSVGIHDLTKQSMAALLNSAHKDVSFHYPSHEILGMTQVAVLEENVGVIDLFEELNNQQSSELCP
jgi:hypothetical protein